MTTRTTDPFRFDLIPAGSTVLCALSGGADSMYLLCRLLDGAEAGGYSVRAAHYHHGLRPTAGRDEAFVRDWCREHSVPLTVGHGDVAAEAARQGRGIEETARDLRYAFLRRTAEKSGCDLIATGHQAEDNAETVLLNLIRGCGSLRGIPETRDGIIRPMLAVTRAEISSYLDIHAVPHVEDETNTDPYYARNRVRRELLPLLEALNSRAVEHINAAARSAGEDDVLLTARALDLLEEAWCGDGSLSAAALAAAPRPVALRALKAFAGGERVHLEALLALCAGSGPARSLDLPGGRAMCSLGRLYLAPPAPPKPAPLMPGVQLWGSWRITCAGALCPAKAYVSPGEFYLAPGQYLIRSRREGDVLRLGPRPEKTIKKLMLEQKLPAPLRASVPVLDRDGAAAAAGGLGPHRGALARPGECCLHITIENEKEENHHASGH